MPVLFFFFTSHRSWWTVRCSARGEVVVIIWARLFSSTNTVSPEAVMQHPTFRGGSSHHYVIALLVGTFAVVMALLFPGQQEGVSEVGRIILVTPKFVMDGNSFYGTTPEGKLLHLRLRLIDAPGLEQSRGREARLHLKTLLLRSTPKEVLCGVTGVDDRGGFISDVFVRRVSSSGANSTESESVQENMVRHGWAWVMDSNFSPRERLRAAMAEARAARRGLWQDDDPVMPRKYRRTTQKGFHVRHRRLPRHAPRRSPRGRLR